MLIVRALSKNARLLILDEPTAALTDREATRLFDRMRALSARGVAIIFVSHRLAEVFEISDRIVIMRDGRISGAFRTAETSRDAVVDQMIGRNSRASPGRPRASQPARSLSRRRGLTVFDAAGRELVSRLDISVRHGEILGLVRAARLRRDRGHHGAVRRLARDGLGNDRGRRARPSRSPRRSTRWRSASA